MTISNAIPTEMMPDATRRFASPWVAPGLGGAVLFAICLWLFWDFFAKQFRFAIYEQADWGHTLVIPFIAGYFVYRQRGRLLAAPFETTWLALIPILIAAAAYLICAIGPVTLRHHNLQGACVALALAGLVLLFCGWRAMKWLWFPVLFVAVFGQTISEKLLNIVTFRMQDITARGAAVLLSLGLDVDRLGNTIYIFKGGKSIPLNIAEACSGMRMLMAFLALGVAMAYTGLRHPWQRVVLVLLAVPTAIFVNILRVCTLGLLSMLDSGFAAGDFHSFVGLVWLLPAFLIYLGLMWVLRRCMIDDPAAAPKPSAARSLAARSPFDQHSRLAFIVTCAALLACSLGFRYAIAALNIYLRKEPVSLRASFSLIPRTIGAWHAVGDDLIYDASMIEELGTGSYLDRRYAPEGEQSRGFLQVHVAYYTGMIDAVPHVPDRCFVAAGLEPRTLSEVVPLAIDMSGWKVDPGPINLATGQPYRIVEHRDAFTNQLEPVRMPMGDLSLRLTEFARKDQPGVSVFGGFLFVANGRATATPEQIRLLAFKPSERYAYYCKVQLVYAGPGATKEQYVALVSDFMKDFLPELMLRLPDWQVIERKGEAVSTAAARGE
jgi:exosortase